MIIELYTMGDVDEIMMDMNLGRPERQSKIRGRERMEYIQRSIANNLHLTERGIVEMAEYLNMTLTEVYDIVEDYCYGANDDDDEWVDEEDEDEMEQREIDEENERYINIIQHVPLEVINSFPLECAFDVVADGVECSICRGDIYPTTYIRKIPCTHIFHRACIDHWLMNCDSRCPICRRDYCP